MTMSGIFAASRANSSTPGTAMRRDLAWSACSCLIFPFDTSFLRSDSKKETPLSSCVRLASQRRTEGISARRAAT